MALVCREIQERIEETREEAREECRNVSRTITETICSWMPWPFSELCELVSRVITEVVCTTVWVVVTIVSWVTRIVCEVIFVIDWIISHVVGLVEWLIGRIITLPELLFCLGGVEPGRKRFRICPMVIADEAGNPVVPLDTIQAQIDFAVDRYAECNVQVIASDIIVVRGREHLRELSGCDAAGYFAEDRAELDRLTCLPGRNFFEKFSSMRFPSGLIWPRHVLKAVWVETIQNDGGDTRGCYMLPESFVAMDASAIMDTLAHEMGHACDLTHQDGSPENLMAPGAIRTGSEITGAQCCVIRSSRYVTFL